MINIQPKKYNRPILYRIFMGIKTRCYNKNNKDYKSYGLRGVVCEWENYKDFEKDMLPGYSKGLTIDRIDVNGNYSKENCRWVDRKLQARNRTNNNRILFDNKILTLSEWSEVLKIPRHVLQNRIVRGWSIEKSFLKTKRIYGN